MGDPLVGPLVAAGPDRLGGFELDQLLGDEAIRLAGEVDAACVLDANHLGFGRDGTLPPGSVRVVAQTRPYDHCNFTVLDTARAEAVERFVTLLRGQRYDDPAVRPLMDLEGLKAWRIGRVSGYAALAAACDRFGYLDAWLDGASRRVGTRA